MSATPASIRALPKPVAAPPAWSARTNSPGKPSGGPALAGVKVLNLGTVIAGAYAGAILANFGADVIKIEPPEGDPFRSDNAGFLGYNRGVRGLGLDLKQQGAREAFLELARTADVVIDNYRLGVRSRLGIDYAALKALNPRIISCSITAYGETGPRAALPGFDPLLQSEGGMMASQGGDDDPILYTPAVNDVATAGLVAAACIAALNARERTGEGQEILSSLASQSLLFQLGEVVHYEGRPPNDKGAVDCLGVRALVRYYEAADGWLGIACETPAEAAALAGVVALDLGPDPLNAPRDGELAKRLEAAFRARPRGEWLDALFAAGAPATPALRSAEALEYRWLHDNHFNQHWHHPRLGEIIGVTGFADFKRTPGGFNRPTPEVGEHSRELLREAGFDAQRIEALFATGAVFSLMDQLMAAQ
jgi:crotonobetainyl-CoA:carnitine CoA-transferase CaiB-like acyl-CoA transferase